MAKKFYGVKQGRKPGVYETWDECKEQVDGYSGAIYKSFALKKDAEEFVGIKGADSETLSGDDISQVRKTFKSTGPYAYVDGSYNANTFIYGYGGFLCADGEKHILQGHGSDYSMVTMRNVAGEIIGAISAVKKAIELGIKELDIYYDYEGIEKWATGQWKTNKEGTMAYAEYMQKCGIKINFVKVMAHTGVEGNEIADRLAKEAVGLL